MNKNYFHTASAALLAFPESVFMEESMTWVCWEQDGSPPAGTWPLLCACCLAHSMLLQRLISSPAVAGTAASSPQMWPKHICLGHLPVFYIFPTLFPNCLQCLQKSGRFFALKCKRNRS